MLLHRYGRSKCIVGSRGGSSVTTRVATLLYQQQPQHPLRTTRTRPVTTTTVFVDTDMLSVTTVAYRHQHRHHRYPFTTRPATPALSTSTSTVTRSNPWNFNSYQQQQQHHHRYFNQQQKRTYLFFPTSWKEWELRCLLRNWNEQRIVYVRLFRERWQHLPDRTNHNHNHNKNHQQISTLPTTSRSSSSNSSIRSVTSTIWSWRQQQRRKRRTTTTTITADSTSTTTSMMTMIQAAAASSSQWWKTKRYEQKQRHRQYRYRVAKWNMAMQHRWKQRSISVRHRILRKSRLYADRIQYAMNQSHKWWIQKIASSSSSVSTQRHHRQQQPQELQQYPVLLTEYSEPTWFCATTGRPKTSRDPTGRFVNPWQSQSTDGVKSLYDLYQWRMERLQRMLREWYVGQQFYHQTTSNEMRTASNSSCSHTEENHFVQQLNRLHQLRQDQQRERLVDSAVVSSYLDHVHNPSNNTAGKSSGTTVREDQIRMTWIGHATCLFQQGSSITILTDPIFSARCSPFQSLPVGVARHVPPAVSMSDLPPQIDVCLISHDHYDHLDKESVLALIPRVQLWIVPRGIKDWILDTCPHGELSPEKVIELEWWESVQLQQQQSATEGDDNIDNNDCCSSNTSWRVVTIHSAIQDPADKHPALLGRLDANAIQSKKTVQNPPTMQSPNRLDDNNNVDSWTDDHPKSIWVTCCPTQHWSSRTFWDRNCRLWCSYTVFLPRGKMYFGGDTALPQSFPLFEQICDYVGGQIDLAAIPIGAYEPSFYMADSHANPSEAVQIHNALDAKQSVGIHWGTFALSEEAMDEPPIQLHKAAQQTNVHFTTIMHGESITVDC